MCVALLVLVLRCAYYTAALLPLLPGTVHLAIAEQSCLSGLVQKEDLKTCETTRAGSGSATCHDNFRL